MSRGFVREGDQEELPIIPPRSALPAGVPNYVTPEGLKALMKEKEDLLEELANFTSENEAIMRRKSAEIDGILNLLNERINSARVLDIKEQGNEEVRFGSTVTYKIDSAKTSVVIKIVGVDEANIKERKIAFIAPIAKALIGLKVGDKANFVVGTEKRELEVLEISC